MEPILTGLVLGGLYALLAQSFVLTFVTTKTLSFALGEFVALGAFGGLALMSWDWLPDIGKAVIAIIAVGVIGALVFRFLILPFTTEGEHDTRWLLSTVALSFVLLNLLANVEGASPQRSELGRFGGFVNVLGTRLAWQDVVIAFVAIGVSLLLILLTRTTSLGMVMRAVAQDPETASLMGVSPRRTGMVTYAVAMGIAALAGVLWAAKVGVSPEIGAPLLVASIAVAVVGGLGSLWGPLLGGVLYGVLTQVMSFQFGSVWGDTSGLLLVMAVLVFRPEGLIARKAEVKL